MSIWQQCTRADDAPVDEIPPPETIYTGPRPRVHAVHSNPYRMMPPPQIPITAYATGPKTVYAFLRELLQPVETADTHYVYNLAPTVLKNNPNAKVEVIDQRPFLINFDLQQ